MSVSIEEKLKKIRVRQGITATDWSPVKAAIAQPIADTQLPLWPEAVRAIPNGFVRSALFGAIRKGRRRYISGEDIASLDNITIRYKGERLDQGDLDAWSSVVQAVRQQTLGNECRVSTYALLQLMGVKRSGQSSKTLATRIERLVATAVTIRQGRYSYMGSLIGGAAKDEITQEWVISLDPKLSVLFENEQFSQIEWAVRNELIGNQTAQWLHAFYCSHREPFSLKIETLKELCGSETGELSKFTQTLKSALAAVETASHKHGEAFKATIDKGLVHVERKSKPQKQRAISALAKKLKMPVDK